MTEIRQDDLPALDPEVVEVIVRIGGDYEYHPAPQVVFAAMSELMQNVLRLAFTGLRGPAFDQTRL